MIANIAMENDADMADVELEQLLSEEQGPQFKSPR